MLAFEWDRPFFGYWYKDRPQIDVAEFRDYLGKLPTDRSLEDKINKLRKMAEAYAKSVKKYDAS